MVFIDNEGVTDASLNLALEEFALRNFDFSETYLLFYINAPSIIIGRNQNTLEEINQGYVEENGIQVVRRLSGGGAVYHDLGNLNYSFITDYATGRLNNFHHFTGPVIEVLRSLGAPAEMSGRNDILVEGRKVSGNAQFATPKRMFSHGTLLFDSELDEVTRALDVKMTKLQSKGHKSVRSRVANISEFLAEPMDTQAFRERLLDGLRAEEEMPTYRLSPDEWRRVEELADSRYRSWDWNYGASPPFNVQRRRRFEGVGEIDLRLYVKKHVIEDAKIYGDFLGHGDVSDIEGLLRGQRYVLDDLRRALEPADLNRYFGTLDREEFLSFLYGPDPEE